ncbi:DNA (cytosine-5)-methyltransferase 1 [Linum perenne]
MAPKRAATQRNRKSAALPLPSEAMNSDAPVDEMQDVSNGEMEAVSGSEDGVNSSSTVSKRSRTKAASAVDMPPVSASTEEVDKTDEEIEISPKVEDTAQSPAKKKKRVLEGDDSDAKFLGAAVSDAEARKVWPHRYAKKEQSQVKDSSDQELIKARHHYSRAKVDGIEYKLNDNAHVQAEEGKDSYICKIVEMFEAVDGEPYFTAQWYYRAKDTIIEDAYKIDEKRVFLSEVKDDNPLDCLLEKLNILMRPLEVDWEAKKSIPNCDYYCDSLYLLPFTTFIKLPSEIMETSESLSTISQSCEVSQPTDKSEAYTLLDLYSGCGGMSTGLCLGSKLSGQELITVRNEKVDDFLKLLEEWEKLCIRFSLVSSSDPEKKQAYPFDAEEDESDDADDEEDGDDDAPDDEECFELEKVLNICYGKPDDKDCGLYFKVQWKGYGPEYDSWEPITGLGNCLKAIREFVTDGFNRMILPLPGSVDVICGGPPCQGISGFNRFRNTEDPLNDEKNKQLIVYMDVVKYLRPKYVLMENVVDILKFANGYLGRYAVGRLIEMNYQTRIGMLAAGAYGLPQFRMRVFLWGALPTQDLPPYPMPTHDVLVRGVIPTKFEVGNNEERDEMPYTMEPQTEFQRLIRWRTPEALDLQSPSLNSHRPYECNADDYERISHIPKKKGANFRDLPGVRVRADNKVEFDPDIERVLLKSKKPLVPDYAMTFVKGTSSKPFGRLWWDETVPTVVTRPEPHNQVIIHPEQDRVLSVRENARLQGFPDYYKLVGSIKERYIQVGNAVAVPVSRALGFVLGTALKGNAGRQPLFTLPSDYLERAHPTTPVSSQDEA